MTAPVRRPRVRPPAQPPTNWRAPMSNVTLAPAAAPMPEPRGAQRRPVLLKLVLLLIFASLAYEAVRWTVMRVYVPHNKALLVINKYGDPLPPDRIVAPKDQPTKFKGVQEEVLGPGRYFINPVFCETELVDLVNIPAGEPAQWVWDSDGILKNIEKVAPMVGLVTLQEGKTPPGGAEVVPAGFK